MDSYTPSLAELDLRLAKLERQNRRLKRLGLLFLLIAGSGFLLPQVPRKPPSAAPGPATPAATYGTLVVHRLELRDKAGKLRGVWTAEGERPTLAFSDAAGAEGSRIIADLFLKAGLPVPLKLATPAGKDLSEYMQGGATCK